MTPHRRDPATDIGPYYKGIGLLVLLGTFALLGIKSWRGDPFTWIDFGLAALGLLALLALIRPVAFDAVVRRLAAWMPWTKYGGGAPPPPPGGPA